MSRVLLALALVGGLMMGAAVPAHAESEHQPFTANGTVLRIVAAPTLHEAMDVVNDQFGALEARSDDSGTGVVNRYAAFSTSDITGEAQIVWLDLSWLNDADHGDFVNLVDGEAIQVELHERPDGSFLAIRYWELVKGSKVNNTDWGIDEANTTRDDSIEARVDNVPDDDEARRQGDRFDEKGREVDHDDD
jgi:hypothetical protein